MMQFIRKSSCLGMISLGACALLSTGFASAAVEAVDGNAVKSPEPVCCQAAKAVAAAKNASECSAHPLVVAVEAATVAASECNAAKEIVATEIANVVGDVKTCDVAAKTASECTATAKEGVFNVAAIQAANQSVSAYSAAKAASAYSATKNVIGVEAANRSASECCRAARTDLGTTALLTDSGTFQLVGTEIGFGEPKQSQSVVTLKRTKSDAHESISLNINGKTYDVGSMEEAQKILEKHGLSGLVQSDFHFGDGGTSPHGIIDLKKSSGGVFELRGHQGGDVQVFSFGGGEGGVSRFGGRVILRQGDGEDQVFELKRGDGGTFELRGESLGDVHIFGIGGGAGGGGHNMTLRSLTDVNLAELQKLTDVNLGVLQNLTDGRLQVVSEKPKAMLGVMLGTMGAEELEALGLNERVGVKISDAVAGTPAAEAGIEAGDVIVAVTVNGNSSRVNMESLRAIIAKQAPGTTMQFVILRDGKKIERKVKLAKWDDEKLGVPPNAASIKLQVLREMPELNRLRELTIRPAIRIEEFRFGGGDGDAPHGRFEFRGDALEKMMLQFKEMPGMSKGDMGRLQERLQEAFKRFSGDGQSFHWKSEDGDFEGHVEMKFEFHDGDAHGDRHDLRVERRHAEGDERHEVRRDRPDAPQRPLLHRIERDAPNIEGLLERIERRMQEFEERLERMMLEQRRMEERMRNRRSGNSNDA